MPKLSYVVFALAFCACNSSKQISMSSVNNGSAEDDKEWVSLFDGKTTKGWHTYGKTTIGKAWKVEEGTLHLDGASKKDWQTAEGGDIISDEEFENFDLKLEWKISPKGNSGIIFYINEDLAKYPYPWHTGPEVQVLDNGTPTAPGHADGKLYTHRAGDLYDLLASKEAAKPAGEWNAVEIVANKGKLDFYLNGEHTLSTTMWNDTWKQMVAISKFKDMPAFGTFQKGKIGLQDHGNDVWFRNIKIKRL
jgi:hypothetical protein